jgi:hypothetical protein
MEFKSFHNDFFRANCGAYSRITSREYFDSQITLTDNEAEIVINYFGHENINVGNVGSDINKSLKRFLLYNSEYQEYNPIYLNLVFPKPAKSELRLYLAESRGYKPKGGDIWFIYLNLNNELVIGSLEEKIWNTLGQNDIDDVFYQARIEDTINIERPFDISSEGKIVTSFSSGRLIYVRDPKLAINRLFKSEFRCEVDSSHVTFTAEKTKLPFMEAHHFIPMRFQHLFNSPLDNLNNIICLCPNCHRAMHHAIINYKYELIKQIYFKRPEMHQFSVDDIAQYYNCLEIVQ